MAFFLLDFMLLGSAEDLSLFPFANICTHLVTNALLKPACEGDSQGGKVDSLSKPRLSTGWPLKASAFTEDSLSKPQLSRG